MKVQEEEIREVFLAWLTLTLSTAMVFFYFQATCQKILRRQIECEHFQSIANLIRLEFRSVRQSLGESRAAVDYHWLPGALQCDFHALRYLLRNVANGSPRYANDVRLLTLYFRWQLVSLAIRRLLKAGETNAILRLISVLEYFANVVGQRFHDAKPADLAAAE
jgi:hypothetical protein